MEEYKRIGRELVAHGAILDYYQDTIQVSNRSEERRVGKEC